MQLHIVVIVPYSFRLLLLRFCLPVSYSIFEKIMPNWFETWFDTEYYHLLYNKRDDNEARDFIRSICSLIHIPSGSAFADVACGKGRHSRVLASLGMRVHGFDISANSIQYAQSIATAQESYTVHDMRNALPVQHLDAAINVFTSFGYFDTDEEDQRAIGNIYNALKPGAWFIQDYLNAASVLPHLPKREGEIREGINFQIHKYVDSGFIRKEINVADGNQSYDFEESVKIYSIAQLQALHAAAGFQIRHRFGNYSLEPFAEKSSPRIILVSQKM